MVVQLVEHLGRRVHRSGLLRFRGTAIVHGHHRTASVSFESHRCDGLAGAPLIVGPNEARVRRIYLKVVGGTGLEPVTPSV